MTTTAHPDPDIFGATLTPPADPARYLPTDLLAVSDLGAALVAGGASATRAAVLRWLWAGLADRPDVQILGLGVPMAAPAMAQRCTVLTTPTAPAEAHRDALARLGAEMHRRFAQAPASDLPTLVVLIADPACAAVAADPASVAVATELAKMGRHARTATVWSAHHAARIPAPVRDCAPAVITCTHDHTLTLSSETGPGPGRLTLPTITPALVAEVAERTRALTRPVPGVTD